MADLDVLGRRLAAIIEKKRPDISEQQRDLAVRWVIDHVDPSDDLTEFWSTFYEEAS